MRLARHCFCVTAAVLITQFGTEARQLVQHQIRDTKGAVSCVLTIPPTASDFAAADSIRVDIRVPATPDATLLGKLPAARRDYSKLPIAVYLVPAPVKGETAKGKPAIVLPISTDLTQRHLGLAPDPDLDWWVQVVFQRGGLKEQLDIVAERTAQAASGEKVTTQTRCRLSATDAAVWK